jgi:hypothetical protein
MDMRRKMAATPAEAFGSDERALIQDMGVDLGLEVLVVAEDPETVARIRDLAKRNGHKASTLQDAIALLSQLPLKPYDALVMVRHDTHRTPHTARTAVHGGVCVCVCVVYCV